MTIISQRIDTHEFSDSGDGTCSYPIYQTTCGYPVNHVIHGYKALPADWYEDSSLETWFPITAEQFKLVKIERDELRNALKDILGKINACERLRGTSNYACRWCYAFGGDPKQVHHSADCAYNNARAALREKEQPKP